MTRLLVVDGGQSTVRVRVSTAEDRPNTVVELPGVTRLDQPAEAIPKKVSDAMENLQYPPIDRVVLGLTTAPSDADECEVLAQRIASITGARDVWLADDSVTAHAAAFSGETGVALWAGTGVACFAVSPDALRTFDGLGFLLGDYGGAFWIGRTALKQILRDFDLGRPQRGLLPTRAAQHFGSLKNLHIAVHDSPTRIDDIAQFARIVLDSASEDPQAGNLVREAARLLAETASTAAAWVGANTPLALGGRLLTSHPVLFEALSEVLRNNSGISQLTRVSTSIVDGAMWLGRQSHPGRYREAVFVWDGRSGS